LSGRTARFVVLPRGVEAPPVVHIPRRSRYAVPEPNREILTNEQIAEAMARLAEAANTARWQLSNALGTVRNAVGAVLVD
jgi:hypothetical protein